jgi:hypothetical protein
MSSRTCEAITSNGFVCVNRSKYTTDTGKHYCKIHCKQLYGSSLPDEDTTECSICYDSVNNGSSFLTMCNHVFCKKCFNKWTRKNDSCPLCRAIVKPQQPPAEEVVEGPMNDVDFFTFMNRLINENRLYIDHNVITVANAYDHERSVIQQWEAINDNTVIIRF